MLLINIISHSHHCLLYYSALALMILSIHSQKYLQCLCYHICSVSVIINFVILMVIEKHFCVLLHFSNTENTLTGKSQKFSLALKTYHSCL